MHTTILTKDKFGTQPALDDAPAAEVKAHSEVDQATANLAYKNQQLVVTQIDRIKVGDPVRVGVDTYPRQADLRLCRSRPSCQLPSRSLRSSRRITPPAILPRSYAASPCASASIAVTAMPFSHALTRRWKRLSRSLRPTMPLQPNAVTGSVAHSTHRRTWQRDYLRNYRSILGWAGLVPRVLPPCRFRLRPGINSLMLRWELPPKLPNLYRAHNFAMFTYYDFGQT